MGGRTPRSRGPFVPRPLNPTRNCLTRDEALDAFDCHHAYAPDGYVSRRFACWLAAVRPRTHASSCESPAFSHRVWLRESVAPMVGNLTGSMIAWLLSRISCVVNLGRYCKLDLVRGRGGNVVDGTQTYPMIARCAGDLDARLPGQRRLVCETVMEGVATHLCSVELCPKYTTAVDRSLLKTLLSCNFLVHRLDLPSWDTS